MVWKQSSRSTLHTADKTEQHRRINDGAALYMGGKEKEGQSYLRSALTMTESSQLIAVNIEINPSHSLNGTVPFFRNQDRDFQKR